MDRREALSTLLIPSSIYMTNLSKLSAHAVNSTFTRLNRARGDGYNWHYTHQPLAEILRLSSRDIFKYPSNGENDTTRSDTREELGCHSRADMHGRILKDLRL